MICRLTKVEQDHLKKKELELQSVVFHLSSCESSLKSLPKRIRQYKSRIKKLQKQIKFLGGLK